MQQQGEANADTSAFNDLALIKIDPADASKVNPSIPFWGGPTGLNDTIGTRQKVLSYGNSSLRHGITQLSPKEGYELAQNGKGWSHQVGTITPGIPGDSGSAFIDKRGRAFGVLSTLALAPIPASNGGRRPQARASVPGLPHLAQRHAGERHGALLGTAPPRLTGTAPPSDPGFHAGGTRHSRVSPAGRVAGVFRGPLA
jgi:hypothetical protein